MCRGQYLHVIIDIAPGELISLSQIELILDNDTPDVKRAIFDAATGEYVSGDASLANGDLTIDIPSSAETSYGYGYGYGSVSEGTSFAPPYSYSFTSSEDSISGNEYGYSYAVANANLVNRFLGPATITIEGRINTALLDEGSHTLDVLAHTGSGGNDIDQIVSPQLAFTVTTAEEGEEDSPVLNIESVDLGGNPITGVWITIRTAEDDNLVQSGFTPMTVGATSGTTLEVTVHDYPDIQFSPGKISEAQTEQGL